MFLFSRHFWMVHRVALEHKFPQGVPLWARVVSPIVWVVYSLVYRLVRLLRGIWESVFGHAAKRGHLIPLDHDAIVKRGGDSYGYYALLKCPQCGALVLHDGEHDSFCPDISDLSKAVSLAAHDETCPCVGCGFLFKGSMVYDWFNNQRVARRFMPSEKEIEAAGAEWLLAKK